ncbi:phytoene/squalene synthase family protein [Anaerococcus sp. AGMB09787]|uniref:phytoene/squalene synthase family protein n=1 Tax=Anaerococcus sp. AGMB09787 TaxID=2922869 RepID=UPI001FAFB463|nr:phytoene/squalene synthase family protein [Anaerococcus sp. AGMB09787]
MTNNLDKSFKISVDILRENSKSFYKAFKMLDEEKFLAVAALYGFFRTIDDITDESTELNREDSLKKINLLRDDLLKISEGKDPRNTYPWWDAYEATIKAYQIDSQAFLMQIEGQKMDLDFREPESIDDLITYSSLVAGSVGRAMLPIIIKNKEDLGRPDLLTACENLGIAMQITNILRDVGEDLRERDRVYLPKNLLAKYGLDKENLIAFNEGKRDGEDYKAFINFWEDLARLSESYYDSFNDYLKYIDEDSRLPVYTASLIYRAIMDEIRQASYDCFSKRQFVSNTKKVLLIKKAKAYVKNL